MQNQPSHDEKQTPTTTTREQDADIEYDSALIPLMWLLLPFLAVLAYGFWS